MNKTTEFFKTTSDNIAELAQRLDSMNLEELRQHLETATKAMEAINFVLLQKDLKEAAKKVESAPLLMPDEAEKLIAQVIYNAQEYALLKSKKSKEATEKAANDLFQVLTGKDAEPKQLKEMLK